MRSAVLLLLAATACRSAFAAGQPGATHESVPFARFGDGAASFTSYSGYGDSTRFVVRDTAAWRRTWQTIHQPFFPQPPVPVVDFQRQMVAVAALGTRSSGGFDIVVESAVEDSAGIEIGLRITVPGRGCAVSAVMTRPVDLAKIPASRRPVRFRERNVVAPCGVR